MADVTRVPENAFGYVPTPALVAPIEFTLRLEDYERLGGHMGEVRRLSEARGMAPERRSVQPHGENPWPLGGAVRASYATAPHAEVPSEARPRSTQQRAVWSPPSRPAVQAPQDEVAGAGSISSSRSGQA
jgi:hypothetical protein